MGRQGERHDRRSREKEGVTEVGGLHPPIIDQPAAGSDVEADLQVGLKDPDKNVNDESGKEHQQSELLRARRHR
jgi:hypothetical protein